MTQNREEKETRKYAIILGGIASFVLALFAIYVSDVLSANYGIAYGIGVGATLQSRALGANATQSFLPTPLELNSLHTAILTTYILFGIAIIMIGTSIIIYLKRSNVFGFDIKRFSLLHTVMSFFYVAVYFVIFSGFNISLSTFFAYSIYFTMLLAIVVDIYTAFLTHIPIQRALGTGRNVFMDPEKPFANIMKLRDAVFSNLSGEVKIVDKHFNSAAVENLYRLIETNVSNIKKIDILTSTSMFDSNFNDNYNDLKKELSASGTEVNLAIMSDSDSSEQHERFIFDDSQAYKIPPFNIINKKSEHVTRIKLSEAKARFDKLYSNSIKYENYLIKKNQESR